jgi:hypothetical protein
METPAHDHAETPARRALDALSVNTEDTAALAALANSEVLVPVPDDAQQEAAADPAAVALPVLEQPDGAPVVPVFTSEGELAELARRRSLAQHRRRFRAPTDAHLRGRTDPAGPALGVVFGPGHRSEGERPGPWDGRGQSPAPHAPAHAHSGMNRADTVHPAAVTVAVRTICGRSGAVAPENAGPVRLARVSCPFARDRPHMVRSVCEGGSPKRRR